VWTALPERRGARERRRAARMATPWLIFTSTAGVAVLTAKALAESPALAGALFALGAAVCFLAIGAWLTGGRHDDADGLPSADSLDDADSVAEADPLADADRFTEADILDYPGNVAGPDILGNPGARGSGSPE